MEGTRPLRPTDRDTRRGETRRCDVGLVAGLTRAIPLRAGETGDCVIVRRDSIGTPPMHMPRNFPVLFGVSSTSVPRDCISGNSSVSFSMGVYLERGSHSATTHVSER